MLQPTSGSPDGAAPVDAGLAPPADVVRRFARLRVAIVHHWFIRRGGGERFVEHVSRLFPQADLFALTARPEAVAPELAGRRLTTSFLQHVPGSRRWHRLFMPLFPLALEQFDLGGYDLVLSSDSGPAKGVITGARTCHICYCHSPLRYVWEMYPQYRATAPLGLLGRGVFILSSHYLRVWDAGTAARVDYFATNSRTSAARIRKVYRREAEVIHCPIRVEGFRAAPVRERFYLVLSRLVRYKRVDLAIEACNRLGRELVVIGGGEEAARLRKIAGPTVRLLGEVPDATVRDYLGRCRALLFCGEEDQGLTPLEAQASGAPVIAYGRGGALETVRATWVGEALPAAATGVFFSRQDAAAVAEAIEAFERQEAAFSAAAARKQAERFDVSAFYQHMADFVSSCLRQWGELNGDPTFDRGRAARAAAGRR